MIGSLDQATLTCGAKPIAENHARRQIVQIQGKDPGTRAIVEVATAQGRAKQPAP